MEPDLDSLIKVLMKKGSDTNVFIADEAENALIAMCNNCSNSKVLSSLLTLNLNKSAATRQKVCKCLEAIVKNLGNNILFFKDNDKLLSFLAVYLCDASQEVRNIAKRGFQTLSAEIMSQNDLEKLL